MERTEDKIQELESDIRSLEEKLCDVSNDIMEAKVAIEQAEENHRALITQRQTIHVNLGALRTKLEYAKDGLL